MSKTKKIRRKIRYSALYRLVQFLIFISNMIPRALWLKLCGVLGWVAYLFAGKTRRRVVKQLSSAFPEKSSAEVRKLSLGVFEFLGKIAGDMLPSTSVEPLSAKD